MLTLPKRCLVVVLSPSAPDRRPIDLPISRMVEMKSSAKPPRVSATRGMHVRPIERHAVGEIGGQLALDTHLVPGSVRLQTL